MVDSSLPGRSIEAFLDRCGEIPRASISVHEHRSFDLRWRRQCHFSRHGPLRLSMFGVVFCSLRLKNLNPQSCQRVPYGPVSKLSC